MKKSTEGPIADLVLYKNNQLIALNKPAGVAVQRDKTGDKSLLDLAEIYTKHPLQLVHRLDRPASGIVLLAKNKNALADLNRQFSDRQVQKTYLAVVSRQALNEQGQLRHYLKKNARRNRSDAFDREVPGSKEGRLDYQVIGHIDHYQLLRIELLTGRHHQIRAQLAAIGLPVKGDVKYGARRRNPDRSIHLHAWRLAFQHPISGDRVRLEAPLPDDSVWQAFEWPVPSDPAS